VKLLFEYSTCYCSVVFGDMDRAKVKDLQQFFHRSRGSVCWV